MLRTLAIALLSVAVTIAGSAEAFAQTKKTAKRSVVVHAKKPTVSPATRSAQTVPKSGSAARSKWGVGRYAAPTGTILPPRPLPADARAPRTLAFFHLHTRETISITYKRNGAYVPGALARLNHFLRDSSSGTQVNVDPELFDILWLVRRRLGSTGPYHVVSAYRSPQTNAWLASMSSGVADDSLHMRGRAMDVMLPGRSVAQLRAAGLELGMGGVGYYPRTGFVHLDTGPVRQW